MCAAAHVTDEKVISHSYQLTAKGPLNTTNVMRILLPSAPIQVVVCDVKGEKVVTASNEWDEKSRTLFLSFENDPDGVSVIIDW